MSVKVMFSGISGHVYETQLFSAVLRKTFRSVDDRNPPMGTPETCLIKELPTLYTLNSMYACTAFKMVFDATVTESS
eukprot:2092877-Karenia_brevis.AAC.1